MRTRLFIISSLAVAAVMGAASAAEAKPNGPGDLSPTPTTQPQPCCKDKVAPKPTTTTVPKGPDDIAPAPKDDNDPKPQGPDDLAPAPKDDGGVEPGPDTTGNGSGSDNFVPPANDSDSHDTDVEGQVVNNDVDDSAGEAAATPATDTESDSLPPFVIALLAALVGGMIALLATRHRRDDEHAERV